jgi:hypothetical protein
MAVVPASIAVSNAYPDPLPLPPDIVEGDVLVALVDWYQETAGAIPGFTLLSAHGAQWGWTTLQYRVADGSEGAGVAVSPSWAIDRSVVVRVTGADPTDPINAPGTTFGVEGSNQASRTATLPSFATDAAGVALLTVGMMASGSTDMALTLDGDPFQVATLGGGDGGGATVETLGAAGETGTRTVVATQSSTYGIFAGMVALNPASAGGGAESVSAPNTVTIGLDTRVLVVSRRSGQFCASEGYV